MVNIIDKWPTQSPPPPSQDALQDLLQRRKDTFQGFCNIEQQRGFLQSEASLRTARGQEMARILLFRTLEEYVESLESREEDHRLEELIDSVNYLWSLAVLDDDIAWTWDPLQVYWNKESADSILDLGFLTYRMGMLTDHFRNRAWMNNAQDTYFAGYDELRESLSVMSQHILSQFPSWATFWCYYVAKDDVLQFRLRSNY